MKRIQLFELEDQKWLPSVVKAGMTNLLDLLHKMTGLADLLSGILEVELRKRNIHKIVDLGSGSGGPMPDVMKMLKEKHELDTIQLTMTDLYPSPSIVEHYRKLGDPMITYAPDPVDAIDLKQAPEGMKTLLNSFHHMPPNKAREILKSAFENKQTLFIYEMSSNRVPIFLWALFLPVGLCILSIMTLFMTPFVRPLRPSQLLLTYIIPVIPLCYAWDGQASVPRTYSINDLYELTKEFSSDDYSWRIEKAKRSNGKEMGYYLIGAPN